MLMPASNDVIIHVISLYHISPCKHQLFPLRNANLFFLYIHLACLSCTMYNAHMVWCSLIFLLLSVYKRPPVKRTSPWPVRWVTFPSFEQEPWMRFYAARGHVNRCDVSTQHSTSSLGFPSASVIVATIPAIMSCRHGNDLHLSACFSFVLFLHSPTLIWH